jgi:cytosine/adenosine deaminase-related metal-dependent hydrolase
VTTYRAAWVLPIAAPPIRCGWVAVEGGRVAGVGGGEPDGAAVDLGDVAMLPALVNAHTHLELSFLRGAIPPAGRFVDWVRQVVAVRRRFPDTVAPAILDAARAAIREARASGTGLVGDVSNTLATVELLHEAAMPARVFHELLGFDGHDAAERASRARAEVDALSAADHVRVSLAPHAPYSVAPALFSAIRGDLDARPGDVSSVHLAESAEEVELIAHGTGGWRELLVELGAWTDSWRPPGASPARYLADLGFLDSRVLAVHAVCCSGDDVELLKTLGVTVISCPRSNEHVGAGRPPVGAFYERGVTVAFGTDSLASVADLNVFSEMAAARRLAPEVRARDLLASATLAGARALGFGDQLGSIERGKQAALISVRLPAGVGDVEEYLVGGIEPAAVSWVNVLDG